MSAPAKFLFEIDFAPGAKTSTTVPIAEHRTALAEAEARGYRNGFQAAEAEMRADTERRLAITLEQMAQTLAGLAQGLHGIEARLEAEAVEVACAIAGKLAPALIAREPLTELSALVTGNIRHLLKAPHIAVRLGEALYEPARARLDTIARQAGFEGRLVLLADPDIADGDCRIEWADGGITRDRAAVEAAIAETVGRFIAARRNLADSLLKGAEQ
ncbi:MAG: flagellar assembly protein H [Pseudorhodoplanes sp.]|nr:MAG: flagellar assembly protein H [Pseudorhodoplanes sp.]